MEIRDSAVVVTGGASGIGRALALAAAAAGARGVVVQDLDGDGAERTAAEVVAAGTAARAHAGDVTREEDVVAGIELAVAEYGGVDLYCANAGVAVGSDEQTPEAVWDLALGVNVRAHVVAARRLVPDWLERGSGHLLVTASAAGLLTQIGSAPYAVSKHAAVAFAEWLAVTYGDRGIGVSCLCPMGVDTPLLTGSADGGAVAALAAATVRKAGEVLAPDVVADAALDAVSADRFLVLPHGEVAEMMRRRASEHDRWLAGMRRLQASATAQVRADG